MIYKVGDKVKFKVAHSIKNGIILEKNTFDYPYHIINKYTIRDDRDNDIYFTKEDEILGYVEEKTDYTSFYYGIRSGKSVNSKWDFLFDEGPLYSKKDVEVMTDMYRRILDTGAYLPKIKKVIFNDPATIVFWEDGTKTVVKAQTSVTGQVFADGKSLIDLTKTDLFDPEKGLAMAIAKKALGNQGNYYDEFKKWLPKED